MHISSYDFLFFLKKRDDSIFLATYSNLSSENGEFEKKILKIWRILGHFFPPKKSFPYIKIIHVRSKIWWKPASKKLINYRTTNCHSSASRWNMWFMQCEDWSWIKWEYAVPKSHRSTTKLWIYIYIYILIRLRSETSSRPQQHIGGDDPKSQTISFVNYKICGGRK